MSQTTPPDRFHAVGRNNVTNTPQWSRLDPDLQQAVLVVSTVLPFRTNAYIMDHLIDWDRVPDDPIYQLTFPQRGMIEDADYAVMAELVGRDAPREEIETAANRIRLKLNPHPAGQMTHNVPIVDGQPAPGIQHKYRETVLFFPGQGQTCHAYCTFCFRWAQFVGIDDLKFSNKDARLLVGYVRRESDVTDVLFTGGDPMVMSTDRLRQYIEPLLDPSLERVQNIRIGTKSVAYWPQRFVTDRDADDLLRLFEQIVSAGRMLSIMGHYCHPVELSTDVAQQAVRRIRSTGAQVRMQAPLIRHINDDASVWTTLWQDGVRLGAIPYYMFIERDTGARNYFEVPLVQAWKIYRKAFSKVSGIARTVRGPSMSAFPGKIRISGVADIADQKVFVLEYLQARNPKLVRRPFFAKYDAEATWFDQLEPATEADRAFFPPPEPPDAAPPPLTVRGGLVIAAEE